FGSARSGTHRIEIYRLDACGSGGLVFVGALVTSSTEWSLTVQGLFPGEGLVATSTSTSTSDTSEYSSCAPVPRYPCFGVLATTLPATNVTTTSATLHGTVDGPCSQTVGFFQYGEGGAYVANVKTVRDATPVHSAPSEQLTGLSPNTT